MLRLFQTDRWVLELQPDRWVLEFQCRECQPLQWVLLCLEDQWRQPDQEFLGLQLDRMVLEFPEHLWHLEVLLVPEGHQVPEALEVPGLPQVLAVRIWWLR